MYNKIFYWIATVIAIALFVILVPMAFSVRDISGMNDEYNRWADKLHSVEVQSGEQSG